MKRLVPANAVLIPDDAELKFQGVIFDTYQWQQKQFDDSYKTFEMLKRPDTVEIIGIVDGKILVIHDEQPHSGAHLSFPGGRVDNSDADVLAAAKREMCEETGYKFNNWRLIKVWQFHSKIEWFIYLFLAWDVAETTDIHLDAGEKITVDHLSLEQVKQCTLDKASYLSDSQDIFDGAETVEELLALPEFSGRVVDR